MFRLCRRDWTFARTFDPSCFLDCHLRSINKLTTTTRRSGRRGAHRSAQLRNRVLISERVTTRQFHQGFTGIPDASFSCPRVPRLSWFIGECRRADTKWVNRDHNRGALHCATGAAPDIGKSHPWSIGRKRVRNNPLESITISWDANTAFHAELNYFRLRKLDWENPSSEENQPFVRD